MEPQANQPTAQADCSYNAPVVQLEDLARFADSRQARDLDRLEGDRNVLLALQLAEFSGASWDRFAAVLVEYGYAVVRAWTYSGDILTKCQAKGIPVPARRYLRDADIEDLVQATITDALVNFRDNVLPNRQWDPNKGASLRTFFIGNCLFQFAKHYRKTVRHNRTRELTIVPEQRSKIGDPETAFFAGADIEQVMNAGMDDRTKRMFVLHAAGWQIDEIAPELGLTVGAIESKMYRYRQSVKRPA